MTDEVITKRKPRKKRSLKDFLISMILLISWIIAVAVTIMVFKLIFDIVGVHFTYSTGERAGLVVKVSEKGIIWKTWEGEATMYQGGVAATYIWSFTVDNQDPRKQEIIEKIQTAFQTGRPVKLIYLQTLGTPPWRGSSTYFIKDVVFINSNN